MTDKNINQQITELNQKVDVLLEYVNQQRLSTQSVQDLINDVSIIGKDVYDSTVEELDKRQVELKPEELTELAVSFLRNINNFNVMMSGFESVIDLGKDLTPIVTESILDFTKQLAKYEEKGYFKFMIEVGNIFNNILEHYKPEDVRELSENIVNIVDTVRVATQPKMMNAINNGVKIYGSLDMEDVPEYSIFKLMREMNKPEMKRALGFFVTFMKNMSAETNNNNNK